MKRPNFEEILINIFAVVALCMFCAQAMAHGTVGNRMDDVNHALEHSPNDARLFLKRGRIHQEKRSWAKAMADYERARQLDKDLHEVVYWTGMLYFEQQDHATAERHLWEYIKLSDSPLGHTALGELYLQTGKFKMSALHYDKAIKLDVNPPPGLFLKRARSLMRANTVPLPAELLHSVVAGIDQGIARHGEMVTYLELLVDLYDRNGDYRRAVDTIGRLPESLQTAPTWQLRKADLLLKAGDEKLAATVYLKTIEAVEQLPEYRRNVKANAKVEQQARLALDRLGAQETR